MRYYSVYAPPEGADSPERFAFVKDGFSWPAFFVPIIWMLWHRLWLALVWYVVFLLLVAWTGRLIGEDTAFVIAVLGSVLLALEANNLRRASLEGREWDEAGLSFGRNLDEAEVRYFADSAERIDPRDRRAAMLRAAASSGPVPDAGHDQPILGLFPEPER
jgi:hypothetical protein